MRLISLRILCAEDITAIFERNVITSMTRNTTVFTSNLVSTNRLFKQLQRASTAGLYGYSCNRLPLYPACKRTELPEFLVVFNKGFNGQQDDCPCYVKDGATASHSLKSRRCIVDKKTQGPSLDFAAMKLVLVRSHLGHNLL